MNEKQAKTTTTKNGESGWQSHEEEETGLGRRLRLLLLYPTDLVGALAVLEGKRWCVAEAGKGKGKAPLGCERWCPRPPLIVLKHHELFRCGQKHSERGMFIRKSWSSLYIHGRPTTPAEGSSDVGKSLVEPPKLWTC